MVGYILLIFLFYFMGHFFWGDALYFTNDGLGLKVSVARRCPAIGDVVFHGAFDVVHYACLNTCY